PELVLKACFHGFYPYWHGFFGRTQNTFCVDGVGMEFSPAGRWNILGPSGTLEPPPPYWRGRLARAQNI
ncbi:MAG: hypothetical protein ABIX01_12515, partial [Chitinophagaceae bacterium]